MTPKTASDIRVMEKTCQLAAQTLQHALKFARAGVTTNEINEVAHAFILSHEAVPSPLGYHGFPKSICTSVNDCICHGVPDDRVLKDGDILNIDVTVYKNGFHGDTSATLIIGEVPQATRDLVEIAREAMMKGIEAIVPGATTGDIGFATEKFVTRRGHFVVREIGGHGIGREFHEEPFVPAFGKKGRGEKLLTWSTITVEPMINQTAADFIEYDIPDSTIKYYHTRDQSLSAQFEHTVLVTDKGSQILTLA